MFTERNLEIAFGALYCSTLSIENEFEAGLTLVLAKADVQSDKMTQSERKATAR